MEKTATKVNKIFLRSYRDEFPVIVLKGNVVTVGRSESCDVTIYNTFLSFVHASFFVKDGVYYISDLDSTNGTFVNEKSIKTKKLEIGDIIRFASVRYKVEEYDAQQDSIASTSSDNTQNLLRDTTIIRKLSQGISTEDESPGNKGPKRFLSPEELFPEFEFTEFIFEENVKGEAFDFSKKKKSLEMTVLFGNLIYTIDYIDELKKNLNIASSEGIQDTVVLPIIALEGVVPLAAMRGERIYIRDSSLFDCRVFSAGKSEDDPFKFQDEYELREGEFAIYSRGNIQIILRPASSPPATKPVPFFEKDRFLLFLFSAFLILWIFLTLAVLFFDPPEKPEEDPDLPQKIDRILYKKKDPIVPPKLEEKEELENVLEEKKQDIDKKSEEVESKKKVGAPVIAKPPKPKQVVKESVPVVKKKREPRKRKVFEMPSPPVIKTSKPAPVVQTQKKPEKVVKVSDTVRKKIKAQSEVRSLKDKFSKYLDTVSTNAVSDSDVKSGAKTVTQTGKSGPESGSPAFIKSKADQASTLSAEKIGEFGSDNLVSSKIGGVIGFKNTGKKTVILGSLDPRAIQNVLRRHIPRFAYCYERELERINRDIATTLVLKFTITKVGRVKNYSFTSKNVNFSSRAIRCFARVLTSIKFPKPKGGGIVKVRQPMNLEPKF